MAILKFSKEALATLVAYTKANPEMNPSRYHMMNEEFWKEGTVPNIYDSANSEDVDMSKVEPYIYLVKDQGVYLMTGSKNRAEGSHTVVYADGLGPDADYDLVREVAGGDDFAETLPLEFFEEALTFEGKKLSIELTETDISVVQPPAKKKASKIK